MLKLLRPAFVTFAALTLITGVVYPAIVTVFSQVIFTAQANGSVITHDGRGVGSDLIPQPFSGDRYFWPRPSAAGYAGDAGSGSNLGPTNPALAEGVATRIQAIAPDRDRLVPIDLVTTSGSGLDPHISPEAAELQVRRVAIARRMAEADVRKLVVQFTEGRTLGVLGEPRVNVLQMNIALDQAESTTQPSESSSAAFGWRARGFVVGAR